MKRTKHSLSHYALHTFDMGKLVPVGWFEVLPGDSIRMATSALLRVSPLVTPVMHPVVVRIHHWFCPYRILWEGWEDFITGGPDGLGSADPFPTMGSDNPMNAKGIADYLGVPVGIDGSNIMSFPINAYNFIFNEFYRDQDLVPEVNLFSNTVQNIAWEKDYFTSCRVTPQKGPDVTMPLGGRAPVEGLSIASTADAPGVTAGVNKATGGVNIPAGQSAWPAFDHTAGQENSNLDVHEDPDNAGYPGIWANLAEATAATVNELRVAMALQRYQEARAQYGSRYTEYLRYLGVRSSDARLQRPEYIGGGRTTISFSEVLRTGNTDADASAIGEMSGHGISAVRSRRSIRFFEEHGCVLTLASVRPKSMYTHGLHRAWSRRTKEDYWQKELELIGQQEVFNKEVYFPAVIAGGEDPEGVFGYQDRYAEYRHQPSYVSSEFRDATMNSWHMARGFTAEPALNASFVTCTPTKRIHAVQTNDVLWGMFSHSVQARRMVGSRTIGRII